MKNLFLPLFSMLFLCLISFHWFQQGEVLRSLAIGLVGIMSALSADKELTEIIEGLKK